MVEVTWGLAGFRPEIPVGWRGRERWLGEYSRSHRNVTFKNTWKGGGSGVCVCVCVTLWTDTSGLQF